MKKANIIPRVRVEDEHPKLAAIMKMLRQKVKNTSQGYGDDYEAGEFDGERMAAESILREAERILEQS